MKKKESVSTLTPVFVRGLSILCVLLARAEKHAKKQKFPVERLLEARLAPDMFSFTEQVQYAYFTALEAGELVYGITQPSMSYSEKSVSELEKSLRTAITHLCGIREGQEHTNKVETYLLPGKKIPVQEYIQHFALPNFYFHLTAAYSILRHNGVPLKKDDYLGITSS